MSTYTSDIVGVISLFVRLLDSVNSCMQLKRLTTVNFFSASYIPTFMLPSSFCCRIFCPKGRTTRKCSTAGGLSLQYHMVTHRHN